MKYSVQDFQRYIPELKLSASKLADKLSAIGFEAEVVDGDKLDVTLTSNRKDCQELKYLAFDLAGIYNFKTIDNLISFKPGKPISVTVDEVNKLLGSTISFDDVLQLKRLGFTVSPTAVTPPDFRDVATIADVAEEVVRIIGFDKLIIKPLSKKKALPSRDFLHLQKIKAALATAGLSETATSSFSSHGHVKLKNPFSDDEPYLRESLLDGLLRTLGRNPYLKRAAFFEVGSTFRPEETEMLGIVIAGYKNSDELIGKINHFLGETMEFESVDPTKCQKFDAKQGRVMWVEVPTVVLNPLKNSVSADFAKPLPQFQPISKFPPLVRDITIDNKQEELLTAFKKSATHLLIVEKIDEYQGNSTYRLIFQKMTDSFEEGDIRQIDAEIQKHFFKS